MRGRTTLIITHRVEVAARADRVIELRAGRLREVQPATLVTAGG
jgi:ABC-type multidrug transport system fused ATPase/permease subunit